MRFMCHQAMDKLSHLLGQCRDKRLHDYQESPGDLHQQEVDEMRKEFEHELNYVRGKNGTQGQKGKI